jgi:hypothetical protein
LFAQIIYNNINFKIVVRMQDTLLLVFLLSIFFILAYKCTKIGGFTDLHSEFKTDRLKQHGNIGISTLTADKVGSLGNSANNYIATTPVTTQNDSPLFSEPSGLFAITKTCEAIQTMNCNAFDDPNFSLNCGMCLDIGKNSMNKEIPGGGLVLLDGDKTTARQTQLSNFMTNYVPTVGFCPAGKMVSTKEECVKLQRQLQCQKNQTFDLPGCSQCAGDGSFSIFDPVKNPGLYVGSGTMMVVGNGILSIIEQGFPSVTNIKLSNTPYSYSIKGTEGMTITLNINSEPSNSPAVAKITSQLFIGGYISGETFKGEYDKDLVEITLTDRASGRKPRSAGMVKLLDTSVTKMAPGFGQKDMQLIITIPFSFADTKTEEASLCQTGPYITKASSAKLLDSNPCYAKGTGPGNYSLECLQNIWLSNGCTQSGKFYPGDQINASLLMANPDGTFRSTNDIANFVYNQALISSTGINANGQKQAIERWSDVSIFCTGAPVAEVSPCDSAMNGAPVSAECITYLWKNQGANKPAGATYSGYGSSLSEGFTSTEYCKTEGTGSPVDANGNPKPEVIAMWQSKGDINAIKKSISNVYSGANAENTTDEARIKFIEQCYGPVKLADRPKYTPPVEIPLPSIPPPPNASILVGVKPTNTQVALIMNAPDLNSKLIPYAASNPKMEVYSDIRFLLYNGRQWIAGGHGGEGKGGRLMTSNNGQNWSLVPSMDNLGGNGSSYDFAVWTGIRWIVGMTNVRKNYALDLSTSKDGIDWKPFSPNNNPKALSNFPFIRDIVGTESMLVAVGMNRGHYSQHILFYSTNKGNSWNIAEDNIFDPTRGGGLMSVKYNGSMFVAGGCGEASGRPVVIVYSYDGIKWKKANVPAMNWRVWNVASDGKSWIAGMQYDGILYSPDGINWQQSNFPKTDWGAGKLYTVNINRNALTWSKSLNRYFCSTQKDIYSSPDGINWSVLYPDVGDGVVCVATDSL